MSRLTEQRSVHLQPWQAESKSFLVIPFCCVLPRSVHVARASTFISVDSVVATRWGTSVTRTVIPTVAWTVVPSVTGTVLSAVVVLGALSWRCAAPGHLAAGRTISVIATTHAIVSTSVATKGTVSHISSSAASFRAVCLNVSFFACR